MTGRSEGKMITDLSDMGEATRKAYHKWMRASSVSRMLLDAVKKAINLETDLLNEFQALRLPELKTMPYDQYLQTPEWAQIRYRSLLIADHKCQACEAEGVVLHVHHKTYERLGEELPEDLIVLCEGCHASVHEKEL